TLDFSRPVALMLMGILGHVGDDQEVRSIVRRLLEPMASGSYLAVYDGTDTDPAGGEAQDQYNRSGAVPYYLRSPERIGAWFDGRGVVGRGRGGGAGAAAAAPPRRYRRPSRRRGRVRRRGPQALT